MSNAGDLDPLGRDAPVSPIASPETASAATPAAELERQIMSWSVPKNEREWWALHEIERLRERNAEVNMLAHGWMVAHDMLAAGKPYKLPTPADLPAALSSAERRIESLTAAMEEVLRRERNASHADLDAKYDAEAQERRAEIAERRIEELSRERDETIRARDDAEVASNRWFITHLSHCTALDALGTANGELFKRAYEAEALVTTLKAEVEELKRERESAYAARDAAGFHCSLAEAISWLASDATAAESHLASLTGQVEDMRERAAKVADECSMGAAADRVGVKPTGVGATGVICLSIGSESAARAIAAAIRSLPVLPTTGDGGGPRKDGSTIAEFLDVVERMANEPREPILKLAPTGRETTCSSFYSGLASTPSTSTSAGAKRGEAAPADLTSP